MKNIKLRDIPSGHDGKGYLTINGEVQEAFIFSKLTLNAEVITDSKRFLGNKTTSNAPRGINIKGSMSYHHISSALIEAIRDYKNGSDFPEITLQGYAEVGGSGRCEVIATGVVPANIGLLSIDDSSDSAIIMETDLTAEDFDILSRFNH